MLGGALSETFTHDGLATDLATHLRGGSSRITWEDMQLGPAGSPRPDVYTMEPTFTRLTFEAFECKVSMADFRSDVTSGKWQSYLKYANCVTFAVPHFLKIGKSDVPAACGLIVRSATGWRYAKKPVHQVLTELPWQAWIKLLLDGVERSNATAKSDFFNEWKARAVLSKKFGQDIGQLLSDIQGLPARYEYLKAEHDKSLQRLRDDYASTLEDLKEEKSRAEARCSDALAQLAVALGLPADALLRDLNGRVNQVLNALSDRGPRGYSLLTQIADRMESTAADVRAAAQALGGLSGDR